MYFVVSLIVKGVTVWAVQNPDGLLSHNFRSAKEAQAYADYRTDYNNS